jgi:hypothetical protein
MSDVKYSDRVILSAYRADDDEPERLCRLCSLLTHIISKNRDKEYRHLVGNLVEIRDHKGDLTVRWRIYPMGHWIKAVNLGWELEGEHNIEHYVALEVDDYGKDKLVSIHGCETDHG